MVKGSPSRQVTPTCWRVIRRLDVGLKKGANDLDVPYSGWVEVSLKLGTKDSGLQPLKVPMLVCPGEREMPILGTNVIRHVIEDTEEEKTLVNSLQKLLPGRREGAIRSLIEAVLEGDQVSARCRTGRKDICVKKGQMELVSCRVHFGSEQNTLSAFFHPNPEQGWPDGLEIPETVVPVNKGSSCKFRFQ
ncbi:hypothetical protein BSL78_21679 [Apostichopus japonicus]|uniref:Uncharacterized protein n=1 Tax=Stichopus japonicus TaxID=307972 RepID=A0A2G8K0F2_STIJA|nr:hypothetical protein BSL78_21679 [Apostichopus japonicus]